MFPTYTSDNHLVRAMIERSVDWHTDKLLIWKRTRLKPVTITSVQQCTEQIVSFFFDFGVPTGYYHLSHVQLKTVFISIRWAQECQENEPTSISSLDNWIFCKCLKKGYAQFGAKTFSGRLLERIWSASLKGILWPGGSAVSSSHDTLRPKPKPDQ